MIRYEVKIGPKEDLSHSELLIEKCCGKELLVIVMKGGLKSYQKSVHWHFRKRDQKGTLEFTLWPEQRRIWISIHSGRKGSWMKEAIPRLRKEIEMKMNR